MKIIRNFFIIVLIFSIAGFVAYNTFSSLIACNMLADAGFDYGCVYTFVEMIIIGILGGVTVGVLGKKLSK